MTDANKKIIFIGATNSGKTTFIERSLALLNKTKGYSVSYPGLNFLENLRRNKEFNRIKTNRKGNDDEPIVEATIKKGLIRGVKYQLSLRDMAGRFTTDKKEILKIEIMDYIDVVIACIDASDIDKESNMDTIDIIQEVSSVKTCHLLLTKVDLITADALARIYQDLRKKLGTGVSIHRVNNFQTGEQIDNPSIVLRNILDI